MAHFASTADWSRVDPGRTDPRWPNGCGDVPSELPRMLVAGRRSREAHRAAVARLDKNGKWLVRTACNKRITGAVQGDHLPSLSEVSSAKAVCADCWPPLAVPGGTRRLGHSYMGRDIEMGEDRGTFELKIYDLEAGTRTTWVGGWSGVSRAWVQGVQVTEVRVDGAGSPEAMRRALAVAATPGAYRAVAWITAGRSGPARSERVASLAGIEPPSFSGADRALDREERLRGLGKVIDAAPFKTKGEAAQEWLEARDGRPYSLAHAKRLSAEARRAGYARPAKPRGRRR